MGKTLKTEDADKPFDFTGWAFPPLEYSVAAAAVGQHVLDHNDVDVENSKAAHLQTHQILVGNGLGGAALIYTGTDPNPKKQFEYEGVQLYMTNTKKPMFTAVYVDYMDTYNVDMYELE